MAEQGSVVPWYMMKGICSCHTLLQAAMHNTSTIDYNLGSKCSWFKAYCYNNAGRIFVVYEVDSVAAPS